MKKLLLSAATLLCVALCTTSCEKEITSLDGTTWIDRDGSVRLVFTSSDVTYTGGNGSSDLVGTYTFDPPTVTITTTMPGEEGIPATAEMTGTVKKRTMHIGIHETYDLVAMLELKMR